MKIEYTTASKKGRLFTRTDDRLILKFRKFSLPVAGDVRYELNPSLKKGIPTALGVLIVLAVMVVSESLERNK